jgi:hypothetical protein
MHQVLMWDIRRLLGSAHRDDDQRADRSVRIRTYISERSRATVVDRSTRQTGHGLCESTSHPRQPRQTTPPKKRGNLLRPVLPKRIDTWSPTSVQQRLVKTGGRLVRHARYYWLLLAEGYLTPTAGPSDAPPHLGAAPPDRVIRAERPAQSGRRKGARQEWCPRNREDVMPSAGF